MLPQTRFLKCASRLRRQCPAQHSPYHFAGFPKLCRMGDSTPASSFDLLHPKHQDRPPAEHVTSLSRKIVHTSDPERHYFLATPKGNELWFFRKGERPPIPGPGTGMVAISG